MLAAGFLQAGEGVSTLSAGVTARTAAHLALLDVAADAGLAAVGV